MCKPKENQDQCYECFSFKDDSTCKKMDGEHDVMIGSLEGFKIEKYAYACDRFQRKDKNENS